MMGLFFPGMQNFSSTSVKLLLKLVNSSDWITGIFNLAINISFQCTSIWVECQPLQARFSIDCYFEVIKTELQSLWLKFISLHFTSRHLVIQSKPVI